MAISLIDNLKIQNKKQNVERDSFVTIADMVAYSPNYLPNLFHTMCEETGKMYVYNVNNDIDPVLGKWRELGGGGGSHTHDNKTVLDSITAEKVEAWDKAEENVQSDWNETDDTADGFIKNKPTIPDITGLATETYVDNKVADYTKTVDLADVAISGSYNDLADKPTIPDAYDDAEIRAELANKADTDHTHTTVNGHTVESDVPVDAKFTDTVYDDTDIKAEIAKKADLTSIPSKVSELENDSNYQTAEQVNSTVITEIAKVVADAPEDFDTLKEMSDWIAGHENDASAMNSAISDNKTNIETLQTDVSNINTSLDTKFDKAQDIDKVGYVAVIGDDGNMTFTEPTTLGGNAEVVSYENDDYPELTNVALALNNLLDKVNYQPLKITSFTCDVADIHEIGTTLTDIVFSWSYSKEVKSQALTDCTIVIDDRETTYASLSATKTFVLTASDGSGNQGGITTASKKISFLYPIYYGCCAEVEEYNNDFILALENKKLVTNNKSTYNFICGDGEFAYFATPTTMKISSAWVNGFQSDVEEVATVSHQNSSGHTSSYTISRFRNSGLGSFVAEVK